MPQEIEENTLQLAAIEQLPNEILDLIFSFFAYKDALNIRFVNTHWQAVIDRFYKNFIQYYFPYWRLMLSVDERNKIKGEQYANVIFYRFYKYHISTIPSKYKNFIFSALRGDINKLEKLIYSGPYKEKLNTNIFTYLHYIVLNQHHGVLKLFIYGANTLGKKVKYYTRMQSGVKIHFKSAWHYNHSLLMVTDRFGMTPLHWAAELGNLEALDALFRRNVDINISDNELRTPLHCAFESGLDLAAINIIAAKLIQAGADYSLACREGLTALHHCARLGLFELFNTLTGTNPRFQVPSQVANTPLLDIQAVTTNGRNVLHLICAATDNRGQAERYLIAKQALKLGIDINAKDAAGNTPLHFAVKNNNEDLVVLLLANEAIAAFENNNYENALALAVNAKIRELLQNNIINYIQPLLEKDAELLNEDEQYYCGCFLSNKNNFPGYYNLGKAVNYLFAALILGRRKSLYQFEKLRLQEQPYYEKIKWLIEHHPPVHPMSGVNVVSWVNWLSEAALLYPRYVIKGLEKVLEQPDYEHLTADIEFLRAVVNSYIKIVAASNKASEKALVTEAFAWMLTAAKSNSDFLPTVLGIAEIWDVDVRQQYRLAKLCIETNAYQQQGKELLIKQAQQGYELAVNLYLQTLAAQPEIITPTDIHFIYHKDQHHLYTFFYLAKECSRKDGYTYFLSELTKKQKVLLEKLAQYTSADFCYQLAYLIDNYDPLFYAFNDNYMISKISWIEDKLYYDLWNNSEADNKRLNYFAFTLLELAINKGSKSAQKFCFKKGLTKNLKLLWNNLKNSPHYWNDGFSYYKESYVSFFIYDCCKSAKALCYRHLPDSILGVFYNALISIFMIIYFFVLLLLKPLCVFLLLNPYLLEKASFHLAEMFSLPKIEELNEITLLESPYNLIFLPLLIITSILLTPVALACILVNLVAVPVILLAGYAKIEIEYWWKQRNNLSEGQDKEAASSEVNKSSSKADDGLSSVVYSYPLGRVPKLPARDAVNDANTASSALSYSQSI